MKRLITPEDVKKGFFFLKRTTEIVDRELGKENKYYNKETISIPKETISTNTIYCTCGHKNTETKNHSEFKIKLREGQDFDMTNFDELSNYSEIICENCKIDMSKIENYTKIYDVGLEFLETYQFEETENFLYLYKYRFNSLERLNKNKSALSSYLNMEGDSSIEITEKEFYIKLDKENKKIFYKNHNSEEVEINLSNLFKTIDGFFQEDECKITDKLFQVHLFLNRLANFVSDSKNINIVEELMNQMIGKHGIDILTKVTSIFLGIISYPNLSTIALTKGTMFLYNILNECQLPDTSVLKEKNLTSPIKIFNFLINLKNKELQIENNSNNKDKVSGYVFEANNGVRTNLKFDYKDRMKNIGAAKISKGGNLNVDLGLEEIKVSPFIYNKINSFEEYKTLIKYLKFISYEELIDAVQKYDINLLTSIVDYIEFRAEMDKDRMVQFINLLISYLKNKQRFVNEFDKDLDFIKEEFQPREKEKPVEFVPDLDKISGFEDVLYEFDDSLRMIKDLKWDPKKEFYKINNVGELRIYHDKLSEHYSLLSNEEKNKLFIEKTKIYLKLEENNDVLDVRLIKTPTVLLKEAKDMKNCAGSYVNRISDGLYLLAIVKDRKHSKGEHEKYMLGISIKKGGMLEFDQVKASCNARGNDRFKKEIMKYLESKDISYKELSDLKIDAVEGYKKDLSMEELINLRM